MSDSPRWSGGPSVSHSWSGGSAVGREDEARFGVRCPRCARTQPGGPATPSFAGQPGQPRYAGQPTPRNCVYCGAPLAVARWVAAPPPGLGPRPLIRRIPRPYAGPPSYGASHPRWAFPPVARHLPAPEEPAPARPPRGPTSVAVVAACGTALASLAAAGAEVWRYRLMLVGRFEVLPARPVSLSEALVTAASWVALVLGAIALLTATRAVQGWSLAAARRAGVRPPRSPGAIAARMLVPGWNFYGAGQVVVETRRLIRAGITGPWSDAEEGAARGGRSLLVAAWCTWLLNGLLALVVAAISLLPLVSERWAASNQLAANLVLLHVVLDVLAAAAAVLAAAVLAGLRRDWRGGKPLKYAGWLVAQPESTPRNRRDAAGDGEPGVGEPGDREPGEGELGDGEPGEGDPGDGGSGTEGTVDAPMTESAAVPAPARETPAKSHSDGPGARPGGEPGGEEETPAANETGESAEDPGGRKRRDRSADARAHTGQHRRRE